MSDETAGEEEWDQETVVELRRFALEQAVITLTHGRSTPVDPAELFKLADRFVNYIVGDLNP
ncbi:MAG: hypothetical protein QM759_04555 [Terricaulis sp.]